MGAVVVDRQSWPPEGRIAHAWSGEFAGYFFLVKLYTDDTWNVIYVNPEVSDEEARVGEDWGDFIVKGDAEFAGVLGGYEPQWIADESEAARIRDRYFPGN